MLFCSVLLIFLKGNETICTINSKINGSPPKDVYLTNSKLHLLLAVANLLAHNILWLYYYVQVNSFATAKIECSFEMGK